MNTLLHKSSSKDDMPLKLPDLKIENLDIEKNSSIKFLGVMLNKLIICRDHIEIVESKIAKKIALLHRARQLLTEASIKTIYFSYIHSCLKYTNIALASTNVTKLNKIYSLQK